MLCIIKNTKAYNKNYMNEPLSIKNAVVKELEGNDRCQPVYVNKVNKKKIIEKQPFWPFVHRFLSCTERGYELSSDHSNENGFESVNQPWGVVFIFVF